MALRFAFLKPVQAKDEEIVLEYDSDDILSRLQARVRENLVKRETWLKHKFTKDEISEAVTCAFEDLVTEYKKETVRIV